MFYISINFNYIDDYYIGEDGSCGVKLQIKNTTSYLEVSMIKGNFFVNGITPKLILTERGNALININLNNISGFIKNDKDKNLFSKYTITKFLLLKEILNIYDILHNIVNLSD